MSRLGGVSAFGFGVGLKLPGADRPIVRELVTSLEDRRGLAGHAGELLAPSQFRDDRF